MTFKTYDNFPYFKEKIFCDIFVENLKLCKELKQFELYAFNILYEHIHLLLKPMGKYNYSQIMQFIKRHATRDINYVINEGAIRESRLRGGEYEKFDEIIKNHDMLLKQYRKIFIGKYGKNQYSTPQFKWQKSFHDHIIRNDDDLEKHFNYIINNHLKHGLPEDWNYTSVNFTGIINKA